MRKALVLYASLENTIDTIFPVLHGRASQIRDHKGKTITSGKTAAQELDGLLRGQEKTVDLMNDYSII